MTPATWRPVTGATATTWEALPRFRWYLRRTYYAEPVLQQMWRCLSTGETEWRDLETVEGDDA